MQAEVGDCGCQRWVICCSVASAMGLENREYMQDEFSYGSGFGSRPRPRLSIVAQIIAVTVAAFLLQLLTVSVVGSGLEQVRESAVERWLVLDTDSVLSRLQVWRLVTYALCHNRENLWHIAMNLMTLYFAGQMVLSVMSEREFGWFYLTSAAFAGAVSLVFCRFFLPEAKILGASGAVLAVLTVAALHYPRQQVLLMGIVPVQMRWLLLMYVALDLLPLLSGGWRVSQKAHTAHLGGVLFGFLYVRQNLNFSRWLERLPQRFGKPRRNRNLKLFAPSTPESSLDEQVDRILQKISEQGEASLTAKERQILTQASRQLRKNRGS